MVRRKVCRGRGVAHAHRRVQGWLTRSMQRVCIKWITVTEDWVRACGGLSARTRKIVTNFTGTEGHGCVRTTFLAACACSAAGAFAQKRMAQQASSPAGTALPYSRAHTCPYLTTCPTPFFARTHLLTHAYTGHRYTRAQIHSACLWLQNHVHLRAPAPCRP